MQTSYPLTCGDRIIPAYIMVADALALCIAKKLASMILTMSYMRKDLNYLGVMSVWRNDTNCRYIFSVSHKNLAGTGLLKCEKSHEI